MRKIAPGQLHMQLQYAGYSAFRIQGI
jgi:hypothetical protein